PASSTRGIFRTRPRTTHRRARPQPETLMLPASTLRRMTPLPMKVYWLGACTSHGDSPKPIRMERLNLPEAATTVYAATLSALVTALATGLLSTTVRA
ncbi:hypothetical protein HK405_015729, partial [Cladochytrium tenue]